MDISPNFSLQTFLSLSTTVRSETITFLVERWRLSQGLCLKMVIMQLASQGQSHRCPNSKLTQSPMIQGNDAWALICLGITWWTCCVSFSGYQIPAMLLVQQVGSKLLNLCFCQASKLLYADDLRILVWVTLVCGLWGQSSEVWILTLAITNCVSLSLGFFISKMRIIPETSSHIVMRIKVKWGQKVPIMPTISSAITTIITTSMGHFQQSWKPSKNILIRGIKNNLQMNLFTEQQQQKRLTDIEKKKTYGYQKGWIN